MSCVMVVLHHEENQWCSVSYVRNLKRILLKVSCIEVVSQKVRLGVDYLVDVGSSAL